MCSAVTVTASRLAGRRNIELIGKIRCETGDFDNGVADVHVKAVQRSLGSFERRIHFAAFD